MEANKELVDAKIYQSKARRKKFIIALILFLILAAIAVVVTLALKPWEKK